MFILRLKTTVKLWNSFSFPGPLSQILPHFQTARLPRCHTETLPYFHTARLYHISILPRFHTAILPHFYTAILTTLPFFHTTRLPHCQTSTLPYLPHFHTIILPHCQTSTLPYFHCLILATLPDTCHTARLPHCHSYHTSTLSHCHTYHTARLTTLPCYHTTTHSHIIAQSHRYAIIFNIQAVGSQWRKWMLIRFHSDDAFCALLPEEKAKQSPFVARIFFLCSVVTTSEQFALLCELSSQYTHACTRVSWWESCAWKNFERGLCSPWPFNRFLSEFSSIGLISRHFFSFFSRSWKVHSCHPSLTYPKSTGHFLWHLLTSLKFRDSEHYISIACRNHGFVSDLFHWSQANSWYYEHMHAQLRLTDRIRTREYLSLWCTRLW